MGTVVALVLVVTGVVALAQLGDGEPRTAMPGMDMPGMEMDAGTPRDDLDTVPQTAPAPRRDPEEIELLLDDYAIAPRLLTIPSGAYRFSATNADDVPHDVTLVRSDLALDALPTVDVRLDEAALDIRARTSVISAGQAGDLVASLEPGRYVLVCTVPHHYVRERMIAEILVGPAS